MGWQTQSVVQLFAGNTIINPNGAFTYSGAPAAGNLIATLAPSSGVDSFGNNYLQGVSAYGSTFASSLNGGFLTLYSGTLAGGWSAEATIQTDAFGDLLLTPALGRSVLTANNTLDDGSGGMAVNSLTVGGSADTGAPIGTGFFNTQGLASGSYGSTHQHTLPNFPTATHTHPL